ASGRSALLSNLQQRLIEGEVEIDLARAKLAALREETGRNDPAVVESKPDPVFDSDPRILKLKQELNYKQATLRTLAPKSIQHRRVTDEIQKVEKEIASTKEDIRRQTKMESEGHLETGRNDPLARAESDLAERERTVEMLREKINGERGEQAEHGDKTLEIEFARSELENAEEIRRRIAERSVHLTTERNAPERVRVVQKPKTPEFPEGPSLGKKMGMAGLGGFLAPFLLLIGWDLMHSRVFERDQLERQFGFKMVSEIAVLPSRPAIPRPGGDRAYEQQLHLFEESVNSLRTTLAVDRQLRDKRVFVVASSVSGEGKTNLASQLAMSWSLAIEGRVLVVDADLRSPNLHELFGMSQSPGLAEVLRGECSLEDAVVMDWGDRLFVLPAGVAHGNTPSHLFSGRRFHEVIDELCQRFDKIIIDVPPVLSASETLLVAKEADGVLMCTRRDYSESSQIKLAAGRLEAAGINVVGAVLNGAPARKYSFYARENASA
ncbi:MAG: polysaccharide biosynthesis tyrosine autokinase, partial [Planctomycetia bacterium]|nr:polysaccharide biosynthesis tyrosine autokinase [Planctomycetia bacterium]